MKSEPGLAQPNSVVGVSNALPKPPKQLLHYKVAPRSRVTSEKQKKTKIGFSFSLYFFCYSFLWHCLSDLFEFCRPTWDWGKMPRQLLGYFFSFLSFFFCFPGLCVWLGILSQSRCKVICAVASCRDQVLFSVIMPAGFIVIKLERNQEKASQKKYR